MRFGVFWQTPGYEGSDVPRRHWETIEEIVLADKLGFDSAWLAESVFDPTRPMSVPLMMAAAAAQRTGNIRFGPLATQTPLHHPLHLAMDAATCDILTEGRLDLCLGGTYGGAIARTIGRPFGIKPDTPLPESRERIAECIELMKRAWTEETITFGGKYWRTEEITVLPKPVQEPHPPLLLASNSSSTFKYAAGLGLGSICSTLTQDASNLALRLAEFEAAKPAGRQVGPQPANVAVSFFVAESREKAHRIMAENWRDSDVTDGIEYMESIGVDHTQPEGLPGAIRWMIWPFKTTVQKCIYDSPEGCIEQLLALREQLPTIDTFILEFNRRSRIPSGLVKESMKLFAEKVAPELAAR